MDKLSSFSSSSPSYSKKRFKNFFSIERNNEKFFSNVVSGHSTYTSVFRCLWVLTGVKNLPLFNKRKWNFTL